MFLHISCARWAVLCPGAVGHFLRMFAMASAKTSSVLWTWNIAGF